MTSKCLCRGRSLHTIQLSDGEQAFVIPLEHPETPIEIIKNIDTIKEQLGALLSSKKTIMQRAQFDLNWLHSRGIKCSVGFDTKIAAHLLDENLDTALKKQVRMYLGYLEDYELDMSKSKTDIYPLKQLGIYGGIDAALTWRLGAYHRERLLKEPRLARLYTRLSMPAIELFTQIERNGIAVNWDYLRDLEKVKAERIDELSTNLTNAMPPCPALPKDDAPPGWNWDADATKAELLFCGLRLPVREYTEKTGMASVDDNVLQDLLIDLEPADPRRRAVEDMRELVGIRKLQGYFASWQKLKWSDGRIHPTYWLTAAVTGRTGCREPNVQQIPREAEIRRCFFAPANWKLLSVDYSQIELRLAAEEAQDEAMLSVFERDGDIHTTTAAAVLGKPEAEITEEERQHGKASNFGLLYGQHAFGFMHYARYKYGVILTLEEAEDFRRAYFKKYEGLLPWHARRRRECKINGQVESLLGRVRRPSQIYSKNPSERQAAERMAINSPIQGGASDLTIFAASQLLPHLHEDEILPVAFVHDQFLFQVRADVVDKWERLIKNTFENIAGPLEEQLDVVIRVPLKVDIKVGQNWGFV